MRYINRLLKPLLGAIILLCLAPAALAGNDTVAGTATASARASTWIAVEAPFTGDDNRNGYTIYEIATSSGGPFSATGAQWPQLAGEPAWRANVFSVSPGTTYFLRLTFVDPDGVSGANPQLIGPITTPAATANAVTVEAATAVALDTEIYVSVPILNDANMNSFGTIDLATSAGGPWTRRAGSPAEANLPFHPKRARLRSLTPGTDYWIRVTIFDPDGVVGTNPQIIGPINYAGLQNLALGRPVSADPGWGCCANPSQLVDGRIQNDAWFFGYAWTGGTSCWAGGCPPGFKQATIDLGAPTEFNRAAVWYHDPGNVPVSWKFQYSNDGTNWTDAHINLEPRCRTATEAMPGAWYYPACGHEATFAPVTARYFRYAFDDSTLFGGIHGWAVEVELFNAPLDNTPPTILCGAADGLWHANDVTINCTASDSGSGLANPADASFTLTTNVPAGSENANAATDSRQVCDNAGNCATAGPIGGNMVDKKAPDITLTAPASVAYLLNQAVAANYSCADGGAGVASCAGPVASGSNIATSTVGAHAFTVTATDNVGNTSSQTVNYTVAYNLCLLYDPTKAHRSGSAIPIKLQLCDASGQNVSAAGIVVQATGLVFVSTSAAATLADAGNANPDNNFRFDPTLGGTGGYIFNLSSAGLQTGTYLLRFTAGSDPTLHEVSFQIR